MSKKVRTEANRVVNLIKSNKAEYYVADVDLDDSEDNVHSCAEAIRKQLKESNFLILSAGTKQLTVIICLSSNSSASAKEWMQASVDKVDFSDDHFAKTILEVETPFKHKDIVRSKAFAYLRKNNLLEEESEEDEYFEL